MTDPTHPTHPTEHTQHPPPAPHPAPPPLDEDAEEEIILRVPMRPALVARMRSFAAREGASVEALAALWLEEKVAEAGPAPAGARQARPTDRVHPPPPNGGGGLAQRIDPHE